MNILTWFKEPIRCVVTLEGSPDLYVVYKYELLYTTDGDAYIRLQDSSRVIKVVTIKDIDEHN